VNRAGIREPGDLDKGAGRLPRCRSREGHESRHERAALRRTGPGGRRSASPVNEGASEQVLEISPTAHRVHRDLANRILVVGTRPRERLLFGYAAEEAAGRGPSMISWPVTDALHAGGGAAGFDERYSTLVSTSETITRRTRKDWEPWSPSSLLCQRHWSVGTDSPLGTFAIYHDITELTNARGRFHDALLEVESRGHRDHGPGRQR
jgi:hypothetical protein